MATLEKIRNKAGLLVIVVGLALFAFIIGDFLNSGSTYFRQTQETIIEVEGEGINIQEYQDRINEMTEVYKMQSNTNTLQDELMVQIRQSVYDGMVQEIILTKEMDKLGMTVSPEELFDMVQGENISPMIQQMQMFHNPQTGAFDKMALLNFLKQIDDDNIATAPVQYQGELLQAKNYWMFWEKNIKLQRMEQKYTTLLNKAISANSLDAKANFDESAVSSNILYTMQSYSTIPDSTITVSKSEVEKLYNQRKELYKQPESKMLKYIAVDIRPSQEDYDKANAEIDAIKTEFTTADNVAAVVSENSEVPYIDAYTSENALDPEMKQFAVTASIGDVYGPAFENDKYRMFKLVDKTVAPDSVKVSHIMLLNNGNETALADSIVDVLKKGSDFATLAREHSMDQFGQTGGDLGWMTEVSAMQYVNNDFKNLVFSTPVNGIAQIKSVHGTHIIKIEDRTSNITKYKIAEIEMTVSPSSKTYSNLYNELNQFISKNPNMDKLDEAAKEAGFNLLSNVTVTANDQTLGSIKNSRQVIRWAFQNKKGSISEIFDCGNNFVVAAVQGTIPEGYRSLTSVEPLLRSEIAAEKKGEKIAEDLKTKNLSSLNDYAQAMGGSIDSVKFVNFNTRRITGIGAEPRLNAMISLAEVGKVSDPVVGTNGVYVFQVYEREQDNKEYNEAEQKNTIDQSNAYRYGYQSIQSLMSNAKIVDNRIRFY